MRTLTLNTTFGAALVALALAGCPGDSDDTTTSATTTNTTPAQTDPTTQDTSTGTTADDPTTTTNASTPGTETTLTMPPDDTGTDDTGPGDTGTEDTGPDDTGPGDTTDTGDDTTTNVTGLSFAVDIYPPIIQASCSCHVNGGSGGLSMPDVDTAYGNLVDAPAGGAPIDRVEPGDHTTSYLWAKVNGSHLDVGGQGSKMPLGGALSQGQIDTIAQWIDEGALP